MNACFADLNLQGARNGMRCATHCRPRAPGRPMLTALPTKPSGGSRNSTASLEAQHISSKGHGMSSVIEQAHSQTLLPQHTPILPGRNSTSRCMVSVCRVTSHRNFASQLWEPCCILLHLIPEIQALLAPAQQVNPAVTAGRPLIVYHILGLPQA